MIRRLWLMFPLLVLVACKTTPVRPEPGVRVDTVEVVRETQHPCAVTIPVRPKPLSPLPADVVAALAIVGAKLAEWSGPGGYGERADAAIATCAGVAR